MGEVSPDKHAVRRSALARLVARCYRHRPAESSSPGDLESGRQPPPPPHTKVPSESTDQAIGRRTFFAPQPESPSSSSSPTTRSTSSRGGRAMEWRRFDAWSKTLARSPQRAVMRTLAGGLVAAGLMRPSGGGVAACIRVGRRCDDDEECCPGARCRGGRCRCEPGRPTCGRARCLSGAQCLGLAGTFFGHNGPTEPGGLCDPDLPGKCASGKCGCGSFSCFCREETCRRSKAPCTADTARCQGHCFETPCGEDVCCASLLQPCSERCDCCYPDRTCRDGRCCVIEGGICASDAACCGRLVCVDDRCVRA